MTNKKSLFATFAFIIALLVPAIGQAQEPHVVPCPDQWTKEVVKQNPALACKDEGPRVIIGVAYAGLGGFTDSYRAGDDDSNIGSKFDTNGVEFTGTVRLTDILTASLRSESAGVTNARGFYNNSLGDSHSGTDSTFVNGSRRYNEVFVGITMPKTNRELRAIIGYAQSSFETLSQWNEPVFVLVSPPSRLPNLPGVPNSPVPGPGDQYIYVGDKLVKQQYKTSDKGLVVGAQLKHHLAKAVTLDASGRLQPQTAYTEQYVRSDGDGGMPINVSSYIIEPRVMVDIAVATHCELVVGYDGKFSTTAVPGNESAGHQTEHRIVVGFQYSR